MYYNKSNHKAQVNLNLHTLFNYVFIQTNRLSACPLKFHQFSKLYNSYSKFTISEQNFLDWVKISKCLEVLN